MDFIVEWNYKQPKKEQVFRFVSDSVSLKEAFSLAQDIEKTGRVSSLMFIDENGTYWTKKELQKLMQTKETEPEELVAYFDGGYLQDHGKSAQGVIVYYKQNGKKYRIRKGVSFDHILSNNEAEYAALWVLAAELERLGVKNEKVMIKGDSRVVIHQMTGEWPCYEKEHQYWADKIDQLFTNNHISPVYEWIPRKENRDADHLVQQALKGFEVFAEKEVID